MDDGHLRAGLGRVCAQERCARAAGGRPWWVGVDEAGAHCWFDLRSCTRDGGGRARAPTMWSTGIVGEDAAYCRAHVSTWLRAQAEVLPHSTRQPVGESAPPQDLREKARQTRSSTNASGGRPVGCAPGRVALPLAERSEPSLRRVHRVERSQDARHLSVRSSALLRPHGGERLVEEDAPGDVLHDVEGRPNDRRVLTEDEGLRDGDGADSGKGAQDGEFALDVVGRAEELALHREAARVRKRGGEVVLGGGCSQGTSVTVARDKEAASCGVTAEGPLEHQVCAGCTLH